MARLQLTPQLFLWKVDLPVNKSHVAPYVVSEDIDCGRLAISPSCRMLTA